MRGGVDSETITDMQKQMENLTSEFEKVIAQRIDQRRLMIAELKKATDKHDQLNQAHEDIRRVKNAIDLAQKDIHQKRQVSIEMAAEAEEIEAKNDDLDEEIRAYEQQFDIEKNKLDDLNVQANDLQDQVEEKEQQLMELEDTLIQAQEAQRKQEIEDRKRDEEEASNRRKQIYTPIAGDPVDTLMAKHLNESPYNLSVKALGDGHYMFGNKKIFAKIMNEKLVIKAGGGFMLIDEFIKNYGDEQPLQKQSTF